MKKLFTIIAAVFAFAACQKNLPAVLSDTGEIRFGTTGIRVETKAFSESSVNTLNANGFNVAAIIDADNSEMFNTKVTLNESDGLFSVSGKHYYFPNTGTMSFYGVYPVSQAITVASGAASLAYTQNADTDLIATKATGVSKRPTPVMMTFEHLLSQATVKATGEDANADYKLKSVTVTAPNGGTYTYADGAWALSETPGNYDVYRTAESAADMAVSTSDYTAVGGAMSFLPADADIRVIWECFNKEGGQLISSNDQTINVTMAQGEHATYNLILPSNASEIKFTITVEPWTETSKDIVVQPAVTYAVNAVNAANLPPLNMASGTKGSVNWGDGAIEHFDNNGTKASSVSDGKLLLSHEYASAFTGSVSIYVETGSLSAEVSEDEYAKFVVSDPSKVALTKVVPVFTVNSSTGKKVKFAKGNLYWDGSAFKFEDHQYDYPTTWDASHVGHFFWSKDARVAYANDYNAANTLYGITHATTDTFFAADGGAIEGYTVLSKNEWEYLIDNAIAKNEVIIDEKSCTVLKPDGFSGTVADTYTAAEWATAEASGLVALPFAGHRGGMIYTGNGFDPIDGTSFDGAGSYGYYWSSTPDPSAMASARPAYFSSDQATAGNISLRPDGYSVRLVQVVDAGN